MSNSKRKPLLSNDGILDIVGRGKHLGADVDRATGGLVIRDHYERLIDEGKLRVVEEVELDNSIPGFLMCPKCQRDMRDDDWGGFEFCPCGNKIKR